MVSLCLLASCQHFAPGRKEGPTETGRDQSSKSWPKKNWPNASQILDRQKQRLANEPLHPNEVLQRYVQRVGQYVSLHLEMSGPNLNCSESQERRWPKAGIRFILVQSERTEMSVFPEGTVWVPSSIVAKLASEDALAGWMAQAGTHVICGAGQWSAERGDLNFSPEETRVADRGATLALYRAGYWVPDYAASLFSKGFSERQKMVQRDWLKIQSQRQIKNTGERRAARYSDILKLL